MSTIPQWRRPMRARDSHEAHRVATPLELLFDLCFVVAIAQLGQLLHHSVAEHHIAHGIAGYLMVFFAVWWAWMNFTWFASAYDTDDVPYRLTALLQIAGVLVLAAGVPEAFEGHVGVVTLGYAIMRTGLVAQWLRSARANPEGRRTSLRMAAGVSVCMVGWALILLSHGSTHTLLYVAMAAAELTVPVWAERDFHTPWHPHHIAERYGLLFLIVLGEVVLTTTMAVQGGFAAGRLWWIAGSGLVIVFAFWWLYFDEPVHHRLTGNRQAFVWGYGHFFVFASAAALGSGLAVVLGAAAPSSSLDVAAAAGVASPAADVATSSAGVVDASLGAAVSLAAPSAESGISVFVVNAAVCVPIAVLLVALQVLHLRRERGWVVYTCGFLVLCCAFLGHAALAVVAALLAALVGVRAVTAPGR